MKKIITLFILITFVLTGCGKHKDFRDAEWGMTVDQVIQTEEENGNDAYEKNKDDDGGSLLIRYKDVIVNGLQADIEYLFYKEIKNEVPNEDMPEIMEFEDYILVSSKYWFDDLNNNDSKELQKSLSEKYGEVSESKDSFDVWGTDRTHIISSIDTDSAMIMYNANFKTLEKFMKPNNKKDINRNDL